MEFRRHRPRKERKHIQEIAGLQALVVGRRFPKGKSMPLGVARDRLAYRMHRLDEGGTSQRINRIQAGHGVSTLPPWLDPILQFAGRVIQRHVIGLP